MATVINDREYGLNYHGTTTLAAGASVIIWTNGFPGTIGVLKNTGVAATNAFMVSAITDSKEAITANTHTAIDLSETNYTDDEIVEMKWGMSAYKITNGAGSDAIKVNWRIIRP